MAAEAATVAGATVDGTVVSKNALLLLLSLLLHVLLLLLLLALQPPLPTMLKVVEPA